MDSSFQVGESRLFNVQQLLKLEFKIPQFQRPYDWSDAQIEDFVRDLNECKRTGIPLFLGLVVLHPVHGRFAVVDGQQRLTTLMLALAAIGKAKEVLRAENGPQRAWIRPRSDDVDYLTALLAGQHRVPTTLSQWLLKRAHERLTEAAPDPKTLLDCEVIAYVAPSLAGATRLFERINLRGKEVCEFDLVKNKLIELAAQERSETARLELEALITRKYDTLYRMLDPKHDGAAYNADKLLRQHWILFSSSQFKSGQHVLERFTDWMDETTPMQGISRCIEDYLTTLVNVAQVWIQVERPYLVGRGVYGDPLHKALLDFAKVGRESEMQPLIIAAILKWGDNATKVVRFCEVNSFRTALARKRTNYGRAVKWRLGRQLFADTLVDGRAKLVDTPDEFIHQLFWLTTPYWNNDEARELDEPMSSEVLASEVVPEAAFDNPEFLIQYRHLVHYIFWKYGRHLMTADDWRDQVRMDIDPFEEALWFDEGKFRQWDIEHIYPQNANDREVPSGREHAHLMKPFINHFGNLTVLPIRDNRGMQNIAFAEKLDWLRQQAKLPFNELLGCRAYTGNMMTRPHWGPNNCSKRAKHFKVSADAIWGRAALRALGVQPYDERVQGYESEEDIDTDVVTA